MKFLVGVRAILVGFELEDINYCWGCRVIELQTEVICEQNITCKFKQPFYAECIKKPTPREEILGVLKETCIH